jgi:DNA-binding response OmpR family regulator
MKDQSISRTGLLRGTPPTRRQTNPARILIVEDDLNMRSLSANALTRSGYQVDSAEDGAAGWDALQAGKYDLLITDNTMPKMSGLELVKMVRSSGMKLSIVMASGSVPPEALNGDSTLELAATLVKPFTMQELVGTVEKILPSTKVAPGDAFSSAVMAVDADGLSL